MAKIQKIVSLPLQTLTIVNPIITLISDWRIRDPYVAMFKGQLIDTLPNTTIIDISHHVEMFDIKQTAMLMRQSFKSFSTNSIHLILTNASFSSTFKPVVLEFEQHYFIGEDNGIFRLICGPSCELNGWQSKNENANSLSEMIALAQAILNGTLESVANPYSSFKPALFSDATDFSLQHKIEGEIIYFDAFCNVITNIPTSMFLEVTQKKNFKAVIHSSTEWVIEQYHDTYMADKSLYLTGNALGYIEAVMQHGKLAILAALSIGDKITITYE